MLEAEHRVLAGVMCDDHAIEQVIDIVKPEYFISAEGSKVYSAILDQFQQGAPFDVISLASVMGEAKWLYKLGEIAKAGFTSANIAHYAELVRASHFKRELIRAMQAAINAQQTLTDKDMIELMSAKILEIENQLQTKNGPRLVSDVLSNTVTELEQRFERKGQVLGLTTGLTDLDRITNGLQPAKLYIIAGRPSMGKTILAENIATHNAMKNKNVLFFSLEMSAEELSYRSMSNLSGVNFDSIQKATVFNNDTQFTLLGDAITKLKNANGYFVDDTAGLSITEARARVTSLHRQHGIDLIIFDYLQLMTAKAESRFQEVSIISRELKRLAKDFNCPVVALSQLSRKVEERTNKRPIMSDLRESGQIEQDADVITFVYRDEVYDEFSPAKGLCELIIGKNRGGLLENIVTVFKGENQKFLSADHGAWRRIEQTKQTKKVSNFSDYKSKGCSYVPD